MSKAVLFFADGTEECEALLVADLLRRARVEVIIASAMGRRALVSSHGIHLNADALAEDVDYSDVDMVILPGGIPGTPNPAENKTVTDTCVCPGLALQNTVPSGRAAPRLAKSSIDCSRRWARPEQSWGSSDCRLSARAMIWKVWRMLPRAASSVSRAAVSMRDTSFSRATMAS